MTNLNEVRRVVRELGGLLETLERLEKQSQGRAADRPMALACTAAAEKLSDARMILDGELEQEEVGEVGR